MYNLQKVQIWARGKACFQISYSIAIKWCFIQNTFLKKSLTIMIQLCNAIVFQWMILYIQAHISCWEGYENICISVVTAMEFHIEAGEIQYVFAPQWTLSKDFLIYCKTTWGRAIKNRAQLYKISFLFKYERNWKWF